MSRLGSASFILFIWIQTVSLSPVIQGQRRVIGASELVRARDGDAVVLPCQCDPPMDLTPLTVEWSRTELRPDPNDRLKRVPFVHIYTDHCDDDPDMKMPEFVNRTHLFLGQFTAGVASLQILNVTLSDSGTYKCFIPNLQTDRSLSWAEVTLVVDEAVAPTNASDLNPTHRDSDLDSDSKNSTVRTLVPTVVSTVLLVAVVVVIIVLYTKQQRQNVSSKKELPKRQSEVSVLALVKDTNQLLPQKV